MIPSFPLVLGRSYPKQCLWIMVEAPGFLFGFIRCDPVLAILNPGRYDVDLERRVLRQSLTFRNWFDFVFCSSNWVINKPDRLRSRVFPGPCIGMNPIAGAFAVHGFVVRALGEWMPFQCRISFATEFWDGLFFRRKDWRSLESIRRRGCGGGFFIRVFRLVWTLCRCQGLETAFQRLRSGKELSNWSLILGVFLCFPFCNWGRKKPLGWCQSTGMWELWDGFLLKLPWFSEIVCRGTDDVRFEVGLGEPEIKGTEPGSPHMSIGFRGFTSRRCAGRRLKPFS